MNDRKILRQDQDVTIYQEGDNLIMYIEEMKIMTLNKNFKDILYKSFDELVKMRKQNSGKTE